MTGLIPSVLTIERPALDALAALLLEKVGLKITPDGYHGLRLALRERMPALGLSDAEEYVKRLRQRAGEHELRSLLPLVTVGKTEFFRDTRQFRALAQQLLPTALRTARREGRAVKVWSAGCATGEEPYSLAMLAVELGARPDELRVLATDLNQAAVATARLGQYGRRRLVGLSDERLQRFFEPTEGSFRVSDTLRGYVDFEGLNLAAPVFPGMHAKSFDLILCRNVIIYFDVPTIRRLMDRFFEVLRPEGVLLLGYSESLFKVYDRFEMFECEGSFAYRRPLREPAAKALPAGKADPDGVGQTRKLVGERPTVAPPALSPLPTETKRPTPDARLDRVCSLMDAGEFDVALREARELVDQEPNQLAAQLTLGNLHSLMGSNAEARAVFGSVLAREPLCVEARIFGGVAALQTGDLPAAKAELAKALFLEPTLALGHYLHAQVLERMKDHEGARRSYRNAIAQLRTSQRPLAGHYPDLPEAGDTIARAARYALAAISEHGQAG